jgi:hypothetical protein
VAREQHVIAEALSRQVAAMRSELGGPSPSPLEALLADRVIACWLQLHLAERRLAHRFDQDEAPSWALLDHYQNWLDRSQRRYLAAIKTLATVRRLQVPILIGQVNVAANGGKQVNVAASGTTEAA